MRILVALALVVSITGFADAKPIWRACKFAAGALPGDTLSGKKPHGSDIPIDHVVVLMQENRSFDHYFGALRRGSGPSRNASNPDPTGDGKIKRMHQTHTCEVADLDHSWNGTHHEWDGGKMDGFTAANVDPHDPTGSRAMGYYTADELPFYYALYKTFAIGDRYFASALTQTFPNRFYLFTGTSFGEIGNRLTDPNNGGAVFAHPQRSIFNLLDEASPPVTWRIYVSEYLGNIPFTIEYLLAYIQGHLDHVAPIEQFFTDAQNGTLPQVAFVNPVFLTLLPNYVENDEHPPTNVQVGEEFAARVIRAVMSNPDWAHSVLFHTYDEHGGFWDHVPPPPACVPDDVPPLLADGDVQGAFDRYGVRVPVAVVSPYARKHFVSHVVHDHTSILRFIETRFDLPALTKRDANADPMLEFFDFKHPAFMTPPTLPDAVISDAEKAYCDSLNLPPGGGL